MKRRRLAVILGFLILGAIINIAVAWGLAMTGDPFEAVDDYGYGHRNWPVSVPDSFPQLASQSGRSSRIGFQRVPFIARRMSARDHDSLVSMVDDEATRLESLLDDWRQRIRYDEIGTPGIYSVDLVCAGWPMLGLKGGRWEYRNSTGFVTESGGSSAVEVDVNPHVMTIQFQTNSSPTPVTSTIITKRLLPLRPTWPGFAINTLFYAALCWLLLAAPFAFRRTLRRRRGLCIKCAYPIGTNERCTECGAALT